jgi:hypothetical protein
MSSLLPDNRAILTDDWIAQVGLAEHFWIDCFWEVPADLGHSIAPLRGGVLDRDGRPFCRVAGGDVSTLSSQAGPHSCHPGTSDISDPMAGFKVLLTLPA